jgi:hypothetical protein
MGSGVTGQIPLVALLHVEMLPSNKLDNATIHQNPMEVCHVKEMPQKQLTAHSFTVLLVRNILCSDFTCGNKNSYSFINQKFK